MNQDKLEVVRQEIARMNIAILGISELKWTGMGEFNSDDHYIYTAGRNPLEAKQTAHVKLLMTPCPQALHWLRQVT